ncbi:uncharacterized protein LOC116840731 [Odontomachus brunneus]|uniref:uncharacterized protein LOC116840731 n=1 Tax=Odontomachus brunneus TaxID=486640 RepID=UPI0013F1889B|nr:uncharacterized protein LOC116840731 [Odontomachus brunneus]
MGKLPIIPRRDTRDNTRGTSKEEKARTAATAAGAVAVGGAVSRSSAANSAIADSAAADRDRRLHGDVDKDPRRPDGGPPRGCARRRSARNRSISEITDHTKPFGGIVGASSDSARWRCQDAVVVGTTRPRRNTWHADRPGGESADEVADIGTGSDVSNSNVEGNVRVLDAPSVFGPRRRDVRIAGDERTCCASDVVASLHARRPRDRVIRAGPSSNGRVVERRTWRSGDAQPARSRSIGAAIGIPETGQMLHSTVGSITIVNTEREGRNRFSVARIGTADVCEANVWSKGTVSKTSGHAGANSRSLITEARGSIGDAERVGGRSEEAGSGNGIGEPSPHRSGSVARLTEIGVADSSYVKRSRCLAWEAANGTTVPSSVGETIARLVPDKSRPRRTKTDTCWRLPATRLGFVLRTLLLGLLARSLLCDAVLGAPSSSTADLNDRSVVFEDSVEQEPMMPGNDLREGELEIIRRSIVQGLGLQRIPDASKANVSQVEYERAHRKYLKQVQLSHDGQESRKRRSLHVFEPAEHPRNRADLIANDDGDDDDWRGNHRHSLYFPVAVPDNEEEQDVTVDHASLRFLLQGDHRRPHKLEVLVYLRTPGSRRLLLRNRIPQTDSSKDSRWLELDSTEIAAIWLERDLEENHGLELEFLHDGRPTRREISHARLNVFTTSETDDDSVGGGRRQKRFTPEELLQRHVRRSECKGYNNKRCCRHEMTVMFKDLKGFDFIVYPKSFDAGYCKGRCPPLYNPAHHHALLQSLLWKEDRKKVPKPCCAPSKLNQLMVVYFDEKKPTELQVSYWHNITVEECACS